MLSIVSSTLQTLFNNRVLIVTSKFQHIFTNYRTVVVSMEWFQHRYISNCVVSSRSKYCWCLRMAFLYSLTQTQQNITVKEKFSMRNILPITFSFFHSNDGGLKSSRMTPSLQTQKLLSYKRDQTYILDKRTRGRSVYG